MSEIDRIWILTYQGRNVFASQYTASVIRIWDGWVQVVLCSMMKANYPHVGPGPAECLRSVTGLSKGSWPYLCKLWRKTKENSEREDRQPRPTIVPGTFVYKFLGQNL